MIGGDSPVLSNRAGNVQYKLVDIVHHLMKDQPKNGHVPNPQDLEIARVLIHQVLPSIHSFIHPSSHLSIFDPFIHPSIHSSIHSFNLQNHNQIISLERELVVKEYTLEQTMKDLHDTREQVYNMLIVLIYSFNVCSW